MLIAAESARLRSKPDDLGLQVREVGIWVLAVLTDPYVLRNPENIRRSSAVSSKVVLRAEKSVEQ